MTHIRYGAFRKHPGIAAIRLAALLSLLCVMFSVLPAQLAFAADPPPDEVVGKVSVTLPPKEKKPPDDPEAAKRIAHDRYDAFDTKRKEAARQVAAEVDDLEELKRIADVAKAEKKGRSDA